MDELPMADRSDPGAAAVPAEDATAGPFLILHGLEGSGPGHWQAWLADRLAARGLEVAFPDLPEPDDPDPDRWLAALAAALGDREGWTVVCHSLACLLWLRAAARADAPLGAARALLVAPPWRPDVSAVERFLAHGAGAADVAAAASETLLVGSDDDPYCPPGASSRFAEPLGLELVTLPGAGHINVEAGYGPWPDVEAWAVGARTDW
jgi:predicted alpha/beta hydrolase family esterase